MIDTNQIPYLISLIDDDSPEIQSRIIEELASFGPTLKEEIRKLDFELTEQQKKSITSIIDKSKRSWLKYVWPSWFNLNSDLAKLESALSILSEYLNPALSDQKLKGLLDDLATAYRNKFRSRDPKILSHFLFKDIGFKGNEDDYYNPQNSNLIYVIENKKGIPISLTSIYMLVGRRLGIHIEGCNFPGHFLARVDLGGRRAFVDCFSGGQLIYEKDIVRVRGDVLDGIESILSEHTDAETIVRRYLANLIRSYQIDENGLGSNLIIDLFKDLDDRLADKKIADLTPEDIIADFVPMFEPGELIRHKRYGYRGIIVDMDLTCKATDSWYYSNQTQPNRNQAWFHVLVHGSDQVTYVAESNLMMDDANETIEHPLLTYFFDKAKDGRYVRNNNIWPETDF